MRKPKKYHFIYKTINLLNLNYYVGLHSTDDLDDGYLGSGKYLIRSVKKHGKENFKTEILEFLKTRDELIKREEFIVNEDLLKDPLCMNLRKGGSYEKYWIDSEETKLKKRVNKGKTFSDLVGEEKANEWKGKIRNSLTGKKASEKTKLILSESHKGILCSFKNKTLIEVVGEEKAKEWKEKIRNSLTGRKDSEETKQKKKGRIPWNKGKKENTCWVLNKTLKKSKTVLLDELNRWLLAGWEKGRKIKWK